MMEIRLAECPLGAKCETVKDEGGRQILYRCPWYTRVRGTDINTGEEKDDWACAIAWMPALMINTANESRKGAAATESFRNEMVRQESQAHRAVMATLAQAIPGPDRPRLLNGEDEKCG